MRDLSLDRDSRYSGREIAEKGKVLVSFDERFCAGADGSDQSLFVLICIDEITLTDFEFKATVAASASGKDFDLSAPDSEKRLLDREFERARGPIIAGAIGLLASFLERHAGWETILPRADDSAYKNGGGRSKTLTHGTRAGTTAGVHGVGGE